MESDDDYLSNRSLVLVRQNATMATTSWSGCPNADDQADKEAVVRFTNQLIVAYSWIMLVFGTVSNLLSFAVLRSRKLRKSSTFFYLSCLSIIDLNVLVLFCGNFILIYEFDVNIQKVHVLFCKLFSFLIYFLPQFSGWVCAAVSLDRVVAVIFSSRGKYAAAAKRWNRPENSLKVVLVICAFLFAVNSHFFFYGNEYERANRHLQRPVVEDVNYIYCSLEHFDDKTWYVAWSYVDLTLNVVLPFSVMIVSSLIIIVGVVKTTGNLKRNSTNGLAEKRILAANTMTKTQSLNGGRHELTTTTPLLPTTSALAGHQPVNKSGVNRVVSIAADACPESPTLAVRLKQKRSASEAAVKSAARTTKFAAINKSRKASAAVSSSNNSKARNVSILLATNNFVFIVLTLPIVLFLALAEFESKIEDASYCGYYLAKLRLAKVVCIVLMNSNSAMNIFIYTLTASDFRRQLYHLIERAVSALLCRGGRDARGRLASHTSTMRTFDRTLQNRKSSSQNPESQNAPNSQDGRNNSSQ